MTSKTTTTTITTTLVVNKVALELNANCPLGLSVTGSPPQLIRIDDASGLRCAVSPQSLVNHYVESLELPGLVLTNITTGDILIQLIGQNPAVPRKLILTTRPPALQLADGYYLTHTLPPGNQVTCTGFPARIESVGGSMGGKLHAGQAIVAVHIPGQPPLTSASGGFTGTRVTDYLQDYAHLPNRQLVVKQHASSYTTKNDPTADAAFECCGIL